MSWTSEAEGGREFNIGQYALPDLRFSFQMCGTHWRQVTTGWSYPKHDHALFELNYVMEGEQLMSVEGKNHLQGAGDLMLLAPGCRHGSRIGRSPSMTYFCLHFDIDDDALYGCVASLGSAIFGADSELNAALKPELERLSRLCGGEADSVPEKLEVRASLLRILLELCRHSLDRAGSGGSAIPPPRGQPEAARLLRERYALEKKIEDFLLDPGAGERLSDRSLFPPFQWVGLFSVMVPDREFWGKPDRFLAKMLLDDALSGFGISAVAAGEQLLTAVLFTDGHSVPPLEEYAAGCRRLLERKLNEPVRLGMGGVAASPSELKRLYRQSLSRLGLQESYGPPPNFDFVNRTVRLALLALESEYDDSGLSLGTLAAKLGLTPNYMSALFTAETGHTFTWHLTRIRMDRACGLLQDTALKVHQIARRVGYADAAYFSRCFKSAIGVSPAAYRAGRNPH
ncbi:AraC family transcriptional regulator [Saccharibacillus sp. CPCC 101409]|uniref:AraC family transcriptional regulator n=1 Tax=Saccharibacillus sp. CPCC 101409 TaxID=3058041 RepID=UPI0026738827|nr:AraC family transcriptional regulator [Saccharibacillus sp. CPCC 101409]MDO3412315.1 AraC family transcriptional regulator [Saccharibacillus sp. CPCC 101409]